MSRLAVVSTGLPSNFGRSGNRLKQTTTIIAYTAGCCVYFLRFRTPMRLTITSALLLGLASLFLLPESAAAITLAPGTEQTTVYGFESGTRRSSRRTRQIRRYNKMRRMAFTRAFTKKTRRSVARAFTKQLPRSSAARLFAKLNRSYSF